MSVPLELTASRRTSLARLVAGWAGRRSGRGAQGVGAVEVDSAEILRAGRPGLVDVVARVEGRLAHCVFGLRRSAEEGSPLRTGDDPVLGVFEGDDGTGVVVDALADGNLAALLLSAVIGEDLPPSVAMAAAAVEEDDEGTVVSFDDSYTLTVYPWLTEGAHPGTELLFALDEAGFNHLAAPVARWRRAGRDLGVVQERLAGTAGGWVLALTSLRDLYATDSAPEDAGADFAPEARSLGEMTARMHLALDQALGRRSARVAQWVDDAERILGQVGMLLRDATEASEAIEAIRRTDLSAPVIRTHGDFHLGRTARTDQGWIVVDCSPGGVPLGAESPTFRSPLADVADIMWSLHHVASVAASERDPAGRSGLARKAEAWEARNRRAFLGGYLSTPGIGGLVPADRAVVRTLVAVFELERAARMAHRPVAP